MSKIKTLSTIACSVSILFIISCKNGTGDNGAANKSVNEPGGNKKYEFGLHLAKGDKYYYTIKTEVQTTLEVNDKKTETANRSEMGLIYEVVKDSGNIFLLKITYNKLHIVLKKTDTEDQVLDADNAANSFDPMEKLLSNIKGSSISITLNSKGDILNTAGSKEIMDKIMGPMAMESLETKKKVGELVSKLTGQGFVEDNLKEGFKVLPDTGLYAGDSWNRKTVQSADIKFEVNSKYTLISLENGIAKINVEGQVGNAKNTTIDFMGYNVTTDLSGYQEGEFKADMESGLLLHGKTNISIKGDIQILGKTVPVKFKVKKEITAVKKS